MLHYTILTTMLPRNRACDLSHWREVPPFIVLAISYQNLLGVLFHALLRRNSEVILVIHSAAKKFMLVCSMV